MKLDSDKRARIAKLIRLLGSDNAGEVAAAAHKLQEVLRSSGADLHDLAALLEDEQIAAMSGRSDQAGWTHDAPGPPPSSPARRRRRAFSPTAALKAMTMGIVAAVGVIGSLWMIYGRDDRASQPVSIASAPSHPPAPSNLANAAPPAAQPKQSQPPPIVQVKKQDPPPPTVQARQDPPPPSPPIVQVEKHAPPRQAAEVMEDPPTSSSTVPRAKPVVARAEPAPADTSEARDAARSAVGEIIRQIRFPQRIDRAITMVSISAYGSQIVASYRAAVPASTMSGGALRRLAVETACGLPNVVSALNHGATHKARYTDSEGTVTEIGVAAQDCDD
jgi:hypothetical protein